MIEILQYLKFLYEHKRDYFKVSVKRGQFGLHSFTHDLSKLLPSEFIAYKNYFYNTKREDKFDFDFQNANVRHCKKNKHHPSYWPNGHMPHKYVRQMFFDWEAMSMKFGGSPREFYRKNRYDGKLKLASHPAYTFMKLLDEFYPHKKILIAKDVAHEGMMKKVLEDDKYNTYDFVESLDDLKKMDLSEYDHLLIPMDYSKNSTPYHRFIQEIKMPYCFLVYVEFTNDFEHLLYQYN